METTSRGGDDKAEVMDHVHDDPLSDLDAAIQQVLRARLFHDVGIDDSDQVTSGAGSLG